MSKRKLCLFSFLLAVLLASGVWASSASAEASKSETFAIDLIEQTDSLDASGTPLPFQDIEGAMPGESFSKIPRVLNSSAETAANVRIKLELAATSSDGTSLPVDLSLLEIDFNLDDWELHSDGYFYYKKSLAPGELTTPLFTRVSFSPELGNLYQGATFVINLVAGAEDATVVVEPTAPSEPDTGVFSKPADFAEEFSIFAASLVGIFVLALAFRARKR